MIPAIFRLSQTPYKLRVNTAIMAKRESAVPGAGQGKSHSLSEGGGEDHVREPES